MMRWTVVVAALVSWGSLENCATTGRARPDSNAQACADDDGPETEGGPSDEGDAAMAECPRGPFDPHEVRERWKREQEEQDRDERREAFIHRH